MISRLSVILTLCMLAPLTHAQDKAEGNNEAKVVHVNAAKATKIAQSTEDLVIIDIRTAGEFENAHIKGAKNIDYLSSDFVEQMGKLDKTKPTLIHCASGARSKRALKKVADLGFEKLHHLDGGMSSILESGASIPVVSANSPKAPAAEAKKDKPEAKKAEAKKDKPAAKKADAKEDKPAAKEAVTKEDKPAAKKADAKEDKPAAKEADAKEDKPEAADAKKEKPEAKKANAKKDKRAAKKADGAEGDKPKRKGKGKRKKLEEAAKKKAAEAKDAASGPEATAPAE